MQNTRTRADKAVDSPGHTFLMHILYGIHRHPNSEGLHGRLGDIYHLCNAKKNDLLGRMYTNHWCRSLQTSWCGTALQPFTRYHILQHIPILLISSQFLQGYLSTWRGCRAVSRYGIGSVPFPPLWLLSTG